eukprot:CAMPEP_0178858272 /NCGR_PEP_ID=MMETSP0747-20121128/576_1 /TAXON_ID=913974 /ORGANISM="Nitzschia punctata, Strain CCMP561" /LENGTH=101 /DNA_ID=CAMNT_0020524557 /DNA_START=359 /DNA_END=664 /DNA_ORIENTATION=+
MNNSVKEIEEQTEFLGVQQNQEEERIEGFLVPGSSEDFQVPQSSSPSIDLQASLAPPSRPRVNQGSDEVLVRMVQNRRDGQLFRLVCSSVGQRHLLAIVRA